MRVIVIGLSLIAAFLWASSAYFWWVSATQPLTLTLDAMRDELTAAAGYNKEAVTAACAAAGFQVLAAVCDVVRRRNASG